MAQELKIEKKKLVKYSGIFVLLGISIVSRLLILLYTDTVLGVDAYGYIYKAKQFPMTNPTSYERGYVFTLILRTLFTVSQDVVLTSRLFTILLSVLLIITFFLIGKKFLGIEAAFVAAFLASFETQFIIYSTIPYTEIFLCLLIYAGFYASLDSRKLVKYVLFPVVLGLATLTRIEAYLFFIPSMILFTHSEVIKKNRINLRTLFPLVLYIVVPLLAYGIFYQTITEYYFTRTRFDPFQRALIFLKPHLLRIILDLNFAVFSNVFLNFIFVFSVALGIFLALVTCVKGKQLRVGILSENMLPFSLMLFFCLYTVFLTMYAPWGIRIVNDQVSVLGTPPSQRYLVFTKLLLFYPSAYFIYKFVVFQVDNLMRAHLPSSTWNLKLKKLRIRIPLRTVSIVFIISILIVPSSYVMWRDGFESASVKDEVMKTFKVSAEWLSENVKDDEIVVAPIPEIFAVVRPDLEPKMVSYEMFWNLAGVYYGADTTEDEVLRVWEELLGFVSANNVKYLVRDWMQPYCKLIFQVAETELESITKIVKESRFTLPDGYTNSIRIYELEKTGEAGALLLGSYYELSSLADAGSNTSLIDYSQNWIPNSLIGLKIKIVSGTNAGSIQTIMDNTPNAITVLGAWAVSPDNTSRYIIVADDAESPYSWSLSEGEGIVGGSSDELEGLKSVLGVSTSDTATFGIQYDFGASGFNASNFRFLIIPAKISTVRSVGGIYLVDTLGNSRKWNCWLTTTWTMIVLPLQRYDFQDTNFDITAIRYVKVEQTDILEYDSINVDAFWFDDAFSISTAETTTNWRIISGEIVSFATHSDRKEGMSSVRSEVVSDPDGYVRIVYNAREILEFSRISYVYFWFKIDTPTNLTSFHLSLRDTSWKDRYFNINITEVERNTWTQIAFDISRFDGQTAGFDIGKMMQFRFVLKMSPETLLTIWIDDVEAS